MGAWIEIFPTGKSNFLFQVAPFMGAWIEITNDYDSNAKAKVSHPLWVRGLK